MALAARAWALRPLATHAAAAAAAAAAAGEADAGSGTARAAAAAAATAAAAAAAWVALSEREMQDEAREARAAAAASSSSSSSSSWQSPALARAFLAPPAAARRGERLAARRAVGDVERLGLAAASVVEPRPPGAPPEAPPEAGAAPEEGADEGGGTQAAQTATQQQAQARGLLTLEQRKRIFFLYEQKIRTMSPQEKVFEYFASVEDEDTEDSLMTPRDLVHAVVPVHQPAESLETRCGFLPGEPNRFTGEHEEHDVSPFFKRFANAKTGLIDYPTYIFFMTIISVPPTDVDTLFRLFDLNGDGVVRRDEFKAVMRIMRGETSHRAAVRDSKPLRQGLGERAVDEGGLSAEFFGEDGSGVLTLKSFRAFIEELQEALTREEFLHYDINRDGTICLKDFALSMVSSIHFSKVSRFLDLTDRLPVHIPGADGKGTRGRDPRNRVTYQQFRETAKLRRYYRRLRVAMDCYLTNLTNQKSSGLLSGGKTWEYGSAERANMDSISKESLAYVARKACGAELTDLQLEVLHFIFDTNRDGHLSTTEFFEALRSRAEFLSGESDTGKGLVSTFACCRRCLEDTDHADGAMKDADA